MESEEVKLNLGNQFEEESFWIGVVFVNHRIRAKVYLNDTFENFLLRVNPL